MSSLSTFFSVYGVYLWLSTTVLFLFLYLRLTMRVNTTITGYRNLLGQVDGSNLLEILEQNLGASAAMKQEIAGLQTARRQLEAMLQSSIRKVGVVRYQAFPESGGDQSFSIALLDGANSGLVFSGLHSRVDMRVYSKPVTHGQSSYPLSEEEVEAIVRAIKAEEVVVERAEAAPPRPRNENRPRSSPTAFQ